MTDADTAAALLLSASVRDSVSHRPKRSEFRAKPA
jgi:hypothetical protein